MNGSYLANLLTQKIRVRCHGGRSLLHLRLHEYTQCVFPNAVIPQSAWSVPAQRLLQYIPLPNVGSNDYSNASLAQRLDDGKGSARVDAQTTRWGSLSAYYFIDSYSLNNPYPTQQGGANVPGFNALSNGQSQFLDLSDDQNIRHDRGQ